MTGPGTIQITPAEMEGHVRTFKTARVDIDGVLRTLNAAVQSMQGRWAGQAYTRFANLWPTRQKEMTALMQDLDTVSQQLMDTMTQLQNADQAAARRIQ